MKRRKKASTLPELLVTMILAGLLILLVYEGMNLLTRSVPTADVDDFGKELLELQHLETLEEKTDSSAVKDSFIVFYRDGVGYDTIQIENRHENSFKSILR